MAVPERSIVEEGPRTPASYDEPSLRFVSPAGEEPAHFILTTRRGKELRLDPQNPAMVAIIDAVLDNVVNTEQGLGSIDLAERVFDAIGNRGIKIEENADHAKALEYLNTTLAVWLKTEELVKQGKQLKVEETVLDQIVAAVTLSAKEFRQLNPGVQEATLDSIQGVTLSALSNIIDDKVPQTAERLLEAHRLLMERKKDLVQGWMGALGRGSGEAIGGFLGGLTGGTVGRAAGAFKEGIRPRLPSPSEEQ